MIVCPRCAHPLETRKIEQGRAWHCRNCQGSAVLLPVLRRINAAVSEEMWRLARAAPVGTVPCPFCRQRMQVVAADAHRPELDVCRFCFSVWCDAGERERISRPPDRSPLPIPDPGLDYGRELAKQVRRQYEIEHMGGTDAPDSEVKKWFGYLGLPVLDESSATVIRPWLTWGLAAALIVIHLLVMGSLAAAISGWGYVPSHWSRHGGLTIITSFFLHAGWLHLLGNLYFLVLVGDIAEAELGRWRMAGLLLAAVLFDALIEILVMGGRTTPGVGASGGISALMAFFVVVRPWSQVCINFRFFFWQRFPAWFAFVMWGLLQCGNSAMMLMGVGDVNGIAHLTGAVVGLAAGWWWRAARGGNRE
jgi:membrane associated rhomboid family serine protease/Zn-finger nucleic acid-binding protein